MTPTSTSRPKLTAAWDKTHERVVGAKRPTPPGTSGSDEDAPSTAAATKAERTNFKVLNIRIPKDIHKALRRISIDADESLQNTVIRALAEYAGTRNAES